MQRLAKLGFPFLLPFLVAETGEIESFATTGIPGPDERREEFWAGGKDNLRKVEKVADFVIYSRVRV